MSTMISEVYEAFLSIGIASDKARKAAEALYEQGVNALRSDLTTVKMDVQIVTADMQVIKSDISTLKSDVAALKIDSATVKTDVASLKTDVSTLKTDVSTLKTDVASFRAQMHGEFYLLRWMLGFTLTFLVALVWKVFLA
jgi:outer membrane murein-binding lipoprotein Lpp